MPPLPASSSDREGSGVGLSIQNFGATNATGNAIDISHPSATDPAIRVQSQGPGARFTTSQQFSGRRRMPRSAEQPAG